MLKHLSKLLFIGAIMALFFSISACSNTPKKPKYKTIQTLNQQQKVEYGTVLAIRTFKINSDTQSASASPYGNIGVAASSGGFRGIYGSIDLATIGRLFNKASSTKTAQEIIVKKSSGETVSITQLQKQNFKQGDRVKIVIRNGNAEVIR